ncbi:hypothetical protein [Candidatus Proelusimicrobium excrementi]|uniref:hypothetical protein n=1 Tax=Candidatus Proelusimicrobium excrementi TaxID=3416222 RepID=UPI003C9C86A9|nr:hypothetical protein [Elusimicrobiaceae bacterium]
MNLTKVKIKNNETEIHYANNVGKGNNKTTIFKSWERQSPEFLNCLEPLKKYLLEALDLDEEYGEGMTITGLTLKEENPDGDYIENYGVVISAVKKLDNSNTPACINTPYIPPCRNENTLTIMNDDLAMEINIIIDFCERFINGGERAQGELFK